MSDDEHPFTKMNLPQRTEFFSEIVAIAGTYIREKLARRGDIVVTCTSERISSQPLDSSTLGRSVSVYSPSLTIKNVSEARTFFRKSLSPFS
jgi:hypothetical protein